MNRQDSVGSSKAPFLSMAPLGDAEGGSAAEQVAPIVPEKARFHSASLPPSPLPPPPLPPPPYGSSVITSNDVVDIQALSARGVVGGGGQQQRPRSHRQRKPRPAVGDSSRGLEVTSVRPRARPTRRAAPRVATPNEEEEEAQEEKEEGTRRPLADKARFNVSPKPGKLVDMKVTPQDTTRLVSTGTATTAAASSLNSSASSSVPSQRSDSPSQRSDKSKASHLRRSLLRPPPPTPSGASGFLHQSTNTITTTTTTTTHTQMAHHQQHHHHHDPAALPQKNKHDPQAYPQQHDSQAYPNHQHYEPQAYPHQHNPYHHHQQQHHQRLHRQGGAAAAPPVVAPPVVADTAFDHEEPPLARPRQVHFHFHLHTGGDDYDDDDVCNGTGGRLVDPGNMGLLEGEELHQIQQQLHRLQGGTALMGHPQLPPSTPQLPPSTNTTLPQDVGLSPPQLDDVASTFGQTSLAGLTSEVPNREYDNSFPQDASTAVVPFREDRSVGHYHDAPPEYQHHSNHHQGPHDNARHHVPSDRFLPVIVARNAEISVTGAEWGGSVGGGAGSLHHFGVSRSQSLSTLGAGSSIGFSGDDVRHAWNARAVGGGGDEAREGGPHAAVETAIPTTVAASRGRSGEPDLPFENSPQARATKSSSFPFSVVRPLVALKRPVASLDPKKLWRGSNNNYYRHRSSRTSPPVECNPGESRSTPAVSKFRKMVKKIR